VRETLRLRRGDVWKNLAVLVALPYLRRKLDESYDIYAAHATVLGPAFGSRDGLPPDATVKQRLMYCYKWFLRNIYPSVNAAYYFSLLAFNLAYLFDGSKFSSPFLWLIGTRMRRMGEADHRAVALATQPKLPPTRPGARPAPTSLLNPRVLGQTVYPRLLSSLRILLPTSIFALKFLEWWHASDFARQLSRKAAEGIELPPPIVSGLPAPQSHPQKPSAASSPPASSSAEKPPTQLPSRKPPIATPSLLPILTVPAPTPSTSPLCPICLSPIATPTAAQTGYVFCYTCIYKWVDGSHARQVAFMEGGGGGGGDGDGAWAGEGSAGEGHEGQDAGQGSREGRWESGRGRCAVTGRRVLGGTEGLRRVMV
ncbi:ubiquitin-protein ligase peroxin 12, partial [Cryomyces antarcticus]